jgi:hypothetical protein
VLHFPSIFDLIREEYKFFTWNSAVSLAFLSYLSNKPSPFLQHGILPCLVGLPVPFTIEAKFISSTWESAMSRWPSCPIYNRRQVNFFNLGFCYLVGLPVPFTIEAKSISSTWDSAMSRWPSCPIYNRSQVHFFNRGFCHVSLAFLSHLQ